MKKLILIAIVLLGALISCSPKLNVDSDLLISEDSLREKLVQQNKTLVLFFTEWCGGSKKYINDFYLPLNDSIQKNNMDVEIILLACDGNVPKKKVQHFRDLGMQCYYVDRPGGNPILNRRRIKKFINKVFKDNEIEQIKEFGFGIPVELLIGENLKILNEKDSNKSFEFVAKILNLKVDCE